MAAKNKGKLSRPRKKKSRRKRSKKKSKAPTSEHQTSITESSPEDDDDDDSESISSVKTPSTPLVQTKSNDKGRPVSRLVVTNKVIFPPFIRIERRCDCLRS